MIGTLTFCSGRPQSQVCIPERLYWWDRVSGSVWFWAYGYSGLDCHLHAIRFPWWHVLLPSPASGVVPWLTILEAVFTLVSCSLLLTFLPPLLVFILPGQGGGAHVSLCQSGASHLCMRVCHLVPFPSTTDLEFYPYCNFRKPVHSCRPHIVWSWSLTWRYSVYCFTQPPNFLTVTLEQWVDWAYEKHSCPGEGYCVG